MDVKRVRLLLSVALLRGAGPHGVIAQLERAVAGVYTPRGKFGAEDLDVAFLAKAFGGSRLLYALSQAHGFASMSTIARSKVAPRIFPSISIPTAHEVSRNIDAVFNPNVKPSPTPGATGELPGVVLMTDGVAQEERCRYLSERGAVVGVCREDSHNIPLQVKDFETIKTIADALHNPENPRCHYGKDATVVAVAPYARSDHYSATPLVVSSTCKRETGDGLARWLEVVFKTWHTHTHGAGTHGPIWAFATDGDAVYRSAKHQLCMVKQVDPGTNLGLQMHRLPGLNCYVGHNMIFGTCNPKHVIKRECV